MCLYIIVIQVEIPIEAQVPVFFLPRSPPPLQRPQKGWSMQKTEPHFFLLESIGEGK